jgi:hypothetical protein
MKKFLSSISVFAIILLGFTSCGGEKVVPRTPQDEIVPPKNTEIILPTVKASSFATYSEDKISYTPSVPKYTVNMDENVEENPNLYISPEVKESLNKNYFAINADDTAEEFYQVYESNRYDVVPNFITTDSALHTYHLFFNYLLKDLESKELYEALEEFSDLMIVESRKQMEETSGTFAQDLAKRNLAYFSVAKKILMPNYEVPKEVKDMVENELALIEAAEGIISSYILGSEENSYDEDYTQYIPRGHYTQTDALTRYFKAMMWYGRMNFRLKDLSETGSALMITSAIGTNKEIEKIWNKIFEPINFFVGEPDDLSFYDYSTVANNVFSSMNLNEVLKNGEQGVADFSLQARFLKDPKINSMPILAPFVVPNDRNEETKGFRVFGQRSTVDAMIFQKLIYRDVDKNKNGDLRMLPKALDIPAVFGSNEAKEILMDQGDFEYENYTKNFDMMSSLIAKYTVEDFGKNLYWGWMYALKALVSPYGEGYPSFMTNTNWKLKELLTFLASYTELKHDTILYAKQVYAEMGGGPEINEFDDRGYVEPNPELYNRMKSLVRLTIEGLAQRELLSEKNKENLKRLEEMMKILRDISIKELENKTLTDEEYEFIRTYGGSLEHLFTETLSELDKLKPRNEVLNGHPSSIVADIATDPNGTVLEVGVGPVNKIFVVYPIEGKLRVGVGGVFSHYEFPWPMNDRLTDEKWRTILFPWDPENTETYDFVPEIADWRKDFTIKYDYN